MYKDNKILALIPARLESKGLYQKNIRILAGKPLVSWTIEQARLSQYIDDVIVSTESEEISEICQEYGAKVPFLRPKELAQDDTDMIDVIQHVLKSLQNQNQYYDILVLLQPTSPLRLSIDIDKSIDMFSSRNVKAIVSVCEADHRDYWRNTLPEDGCMKGFIKKGDVDTHRQQIPMYYRFNGALYVADFEYLDNQKGFFGEMTYSYIMPQIRSVDIDTEFDFAFAEFLLQENRLK
ncbi:MAG: acylneuraminate cytidylyltransferase family protein [Candidatus Scalindua sp.]|jgi:CMP-N,N'-diacetyllegionaminic acid synthase|nr:acylneuraminate cytidylyltransferase family protein [Candidatus Scalindua sp.]